MRPGAAGASDESPEHANFTPESLAGGFVRMVLTVPHPDAMCAQALAAGAREIVPVKEALHEFQTEA